MILSSREYMNRCGMACMKLLKWTPNDKYHAILPCLPS